MKRYFLGVDGGRSTTTACVGNDTGRVLGKGNGGGCQHHDSLRESIRAACEDAGIDAERVHFERACLGFAGGAASQREHAGHVVRAAELLVVDDAEIALASANDGEPGIVTIAGTGSISLGMNRAGKRARAGGWGYLFGDEGSALDIVRQAVRAAVRSEEGWGPGTALLGELLEVTESKSANEMLHRFYESEDVRKSISEHAPLVDRVAAEGDELARGILNNAAQQLATLTGAVRRQLFDGGSEVVVSYVGGVFRGGILLERFRMLVELDEGCSVRPPLMSPAEAALKMAMRSGERQTIQDGDLPH